MNTTQLILVSRLINRYDRGSIKRGWTLTLPSDKAPPFLSLQKLNEGEQAHKLAQKFPEIFRAEQKQWRLVNLTLLDDEKARKIALGKI
jgi:hypothetical protein